MKRTFPAFDKLWKSFPAGLKAEAPITLPPVASILKKLALMVEPSVGGMSPKSGIEASGMATSTE